MTSPTLAPSGTHASSSPAPAYDAVPTTSTVAADRHVDDHHHHAGSHYHADHAEEQVDLSHISKAAEATVVDETSSGDDGADLKGATPAPAADPYPGQIDGGWTAWLVVLASFLAHLSAFSIQYSYGIFQVWYQTVDFPTASPASLSLVGTLGPASMFVAGLVSGRLAEERGFRPVMTLGAIILGAGMVLASFATEVWQLALTQGVMYGVGSSLVYFPVIALPNQWFNKKRSLAVGLAVSGSGVGGLIGANAVQALLPAVGSAWTLRILGIASFALLMVAVALSESRIPTKKRNDPIIDFTMLRDKQFLLMLVGSCLIPFGYLTPFYYLPAYTVKIARKAPSFAAFLLTILNVASIVGRIATGYIADKIGNINSFIISVIAAGVTMLAFWLPAGTSSALLIIFAITFGYLAGGFISLTPVVAAQLFGIARLPSMLGLLYAVTAIGNLSGNPIAGAIIGSASHDVMPSREYTWAIVFSGAIMILGTAGTVILRFVVLERRFWVAL
ncbi:hypothetical protein H9P43_002365 [Blastocladiella emersonii ATCC 22665]|nr:hypothetical protein H9P43_002365 [Blastocladiella emersonii ATCC 22665]